jgi:hypothetical protein
VTDSLFDLTTEVEPAQTFTVDGDEYKLLGMQHLSPDQEAKATAVFTRFQQLVRRLDRSGSDSDAERISKQLRTRRLELITMMTTIPMDVAEKLPVTAQVKLFQAIQAEGDLEADED